MERLRPEPEDFDPEHFGDAEVRAALCEGVRLFDEGRYHAAHESFERCWLANEAGDADFYKGLVQASICLHHLERGNVEGAVKLYSGHRRLLGRYLPQHRGLDVARFLATMQETLRPALRGETPGPLGANRPRLGGPGAQPG